MKFKELLSVTENKKNKQVQFNLRKKQLKKVGLSVRDLLNLKLDKKVMDLKKLKGGAK